MEFSKLSRRGFAKLTAASAAGIPLANFGSGLTKAAEPAPADKTQAVKDDVKIVKTNCRACIFNCGVLAHVRNGRVVKLEGNPEYPMTTGSILKVTEGDH